MILELRISFHVRNTLEVLGFCHLVLRMRSISITYCNIRHHKVKAISRLTLLS